MLIQFSLVLMQAADLFQCTYASISFQLVSDMYVHFKAHNLLVWGELYNFIDKLHHYLNAHFGQ